MAAVILEEIRFYTESCIIPRNLSLGIIHVSERHGELFGMKKDQSRKLPNNVEQIKVWKKSDIVSAFKIVKILNRMREKLEQVEAEFNKVSNTN